MTTRAKSPPPEQRGIHEREAQREYDREQLVSAHPVGPFYLAFVCICLGFWTAVLGSLLGWPEPISSGAVGVTIGGWWFICHEIFFA